MKIAMFSWETLHSHSVGGIAAHVAELAAALERRGHEVHVLTRPGYGSGGISRIDGVWYRYCAHNLNPNFIDEVQEMCRSFIWHNVTGLKTYATPESVGWGLGTLFTDFEWACWMGSNGRRAAETTFNWDTIAERTEQCYRS